LSLQAAQQYFGFPVALLKLIKQYCITCHMSEPNVQADAPPKPIRTYRFMGRWQIDLVDMKKHRRTRLGMRCVHGQHIAICASRASALDSLGTHCHILLAAACCCGLHLSMCDA
jgi:hypothetical protein